jgi:hypothetical protein
MREALAVAELASELRAADAVAIGAPMHNFGVPVALKTWLDLLRARPAPGPASVACAACSATTSHSRSNNAHIPPSAPLSDRCLPAAPLGRKRPRCKVRVAKTKPLTTFHE